MNSEYCKIKEICAKSATKNTPQIQNSGDNSWIKYWFVNCHKSSVEHGELRITNSLEWRIVFVSFKFEIGLRVVQGQKIVMEIGNNIKTQSINELLHEFEKWDII